MQMLRLCALTVLAVLLTVWPAHAQTTPWAILNVNPAGAPTPRFDAAVIYDPVANQLLTFGGQDDSGPANDLWSFSLYTHAWTRLQPAGSLPARRFGHTLVYDSVRRRAIVFAGQAGTFFSDVWAYDIAANTWLMLAPEGAGPGTRYGHSAIYDPLLNQMVISHGFTSAGRFDDTWAFQFATNTWKNVTPAGVKPEKRCLHHAVLDEKAHVMYLYGGCSSGFGPCPQDDLWALDLTAGTWQSINSSPRPAGRYFNGLAFDAVRGRLVVYGGLTASGNASDVWEFNPATKTWQMIGVTGEAAARSRHQTAVAGSDLYFFGGNAPGLVNDLIRLRAVTTTSIDSVRNALSGSAAAVAPGEIVAIYGRNLGPYSGIAGSVSNGRLPVSLGGQRVTFNGLPAPLLYVGEDQINAQIPYEGDGQASAVLVIGSAAITANLSAVSPGLVNAAWSAGFVINSASAPAARDSVLVFFATGYGKTTPAQFTGETAGTSLQTVTVAPVALKIGGAAATLLYAGPLPGALGILQINAIVPTGTAAGNAVPVTLTVGDVTAAEVLTVAIR